MFAQPVFKSFITVAALIFCLVLMGSQLHPCSGIEGDLPRVKVYCSIFQTEEGQFLGYAVGVFAKDQIQQIELTITAKSPGVSETRNETRSFDCLEDSPRVLVFPSTFTLSGGSITEGSIRVRAFDCSQGSATNEYECIYDTK